MADFFGIETAKQTVPQTNKSISTSTKGSGGGGTQIQNLDSPLAIDTLIGNDPLLQEIVNKRNV